MPPTLYRPANPSDAVRIGRRHADSWRRHYRGAYSDAYLDGEVCGDRTAVWTERLNEVDANHHTIVAESGGRAPKLRYSWRKTSTLRLQEPHHFASESRSLEDGAAINAGVSPGGRMLCS